MSPQTYNKTGGRLRLAALFLALLTLLTIARPTPLSVSIGFVPLALGEAIRFWAAGHLFKTKKLITSGPYRYTRNPLYLGRLLIFSGLAWMAQLPYQLHWLVLLSGYAIFFGYYLPRKERVEPQRLRIIHGDRYQRYFLAVHALWPRRTAWPGGDADGWYASRMLRNREHWMVVGLLLATLFLLVRAYR